MKGIATRQSEELRALRTTRPAAWRARIAKALREADGYVRDRSEMLGAASRLGVSRDTLFRWLREDAVLRALKTARTGRPRSSPQTRENKPVAKNRTRAQKKS